ncbi:MAG TPA: M23 family metallopeptidase [Polyangiales bacterium]|jgi:murein DD-endopeptidase MepM/ murein hydrolase activator NlpD|nr:M23 family metallopeptidase [Polyangiales bacterium]
MLMGGQALAVLALGYVGFAGWQLQARYGLQGQQVAFLRLDKNAERWAAYEQLATSQLGPTRSELRAMAAEQRAKRLGLGNRKAASMLLTGVVSQEWSAEAALGSKGTGALTWPVKEGWFGRGYGSGESGYHLAVDIEGERGSDVLAAAPGVVGYVGNELRGYGNVVLVVHSGGWVTLYGHNQRINVRAGERVEQGQPLAELGSTGRSMGPHVHFELIYEGRNCDPIPFVERAPFSHRQYAGNAPIYPFSPELGKPRGVRCKKRMMHPLHDDGDDDQLLGATESKRSATSG